MQIIKRLYNDYARAAEAPRPKDRAPIHRDGPVTTELKIDVDIVAFFDEHSALLGFEYRPLPNAKAPRRLFTPDQRDSIPAIRDMIRRWADEYETAPKPEHVQVKATREMITRTMHRIAPDGLDRWFGSVQGRRDYIV